MCHICSRRLAQVESEHQNGEDLSSFERVTVVGTRTDGMLGFLLTTIKLATKLYIHSQLKKKMIFFFILFFLSVIIFSNANLANWLLLTHPSLTDQVFGI